MTREWKPGDAAWIKGDGMDTLAIRTAQGSWVWVDTRGSNPAPGGVCLCASDADGRAMPVAVVACEDREQVERLRDLYDAAVIRMNDDPDPRDVTPEQRTTAMQSAFLTLAANPKPPKPEEPTDPAVRVWANGSVWAKCGPWWVTPAVNEEPREWDYLVESVGFEVVQP